MSLRSSISRASIRRSGELGGAGTNVVGARFYAGDGTVALPSYTFTSDPTTGLFLQTSPGYLGITAGASQHVVFGGGVSDFASIVNVQLQLRVANGTAAIPAIAFASDTDTGIWRDGSNNLTITTGGVTRFAVENNAVLPAVPIRAPDGVVATPSYSFTTLTNTGMYLEGGGAFLAFAFGGATKFFIGATQVLFSDPVRTFTSGSATVPAFSFYNDDNTGIYNPAANNFAISCNGVEQVLVTTTSTTFTGQVITPDGTAAAPALQVGATAMGLYFVAAGELGFATAGIGRASVNANGFYFGVGTVALPGISFSGDSNTGIYHPNADEVAITCGGVQQVNFTTTAATFAGQVVGPAATAAAPTFTFAADLDTGIYRFAANRIGFAAGGVNVAVSDANGFSVTSGQVVAPVGAVGTPSYVFSGDGDTGLYRIGADQVGIAAGGTLHASFSLVAAALKFGIFGVAAVVQQTSGANLTNNVTVGGTDNTVDNVVAAPVDVNAASLTSTRDAIYQLSRKLKQINDGLRAYGQFT